MATWQFPAFREPVARCVSNSATGRRHHRQAAAHGRVADVLRVPGHGSFHVSMSMPRTACCFVRADELGITGTEMPALDANAELLERLAAIRIARVHRNGYRVDAEEALAKRVSASSVRFRAADALTLTGDKIAAGEVDLTGRIISNGPRLSPCR